MRKIREIACIALILVACSIVLVLQKPEEKAKAENTVYTLQDSVFHEEGVAAKSSNCYGYAIGKYKVFYTGVNPQNYAPNPGDFSQQPYPENWTLEELVDAVYSDLLSMGCKYIVVSKTMPQITESERLICVRKGHAGERTDYHFMRYDVDDRCWYHKVGGYDILRYKYTPSNDRVWLDEYMSNGVAHYEPAEGMTELMVYDSEIYYIRYTNLYNGWTGYGEIRNYNDLKQVALYPKQSWELINSITVPAGEVWTPIPTFSAMFNGNGKTIDGLTMVSRTVSNYGFIKQVNQGGIVENTIFNNVVIRLEEAVDTPIYVDIGVIAAINDGRIVDCTVGNSSVRKTYLHSGVKANVGGICGTNLRDVYNCTVNYLEASAVGYLGGIAGVTKSPLQSCTVNNSNLKLYCGAVGGIVGYCNDDYNLKDFIYDCSVNSTEISCYNGYPGESEYYQSDLDGYAGGIIGHNNKGSMSGCSITGSKIKYAGATTDSRTFAPAMGLLCGAAATGVNAYGEISNTTVEKGNLRTVTWKGGFLNLTTYSHNQAKYAGGEVGRYLS